MFATNESPVLFSDSPSLYSPLTIDPDRFEEAYNLDISEYVERNKFREDAMSKGGKIALKRDILYLSYSHAIRLFRMNFPELEVDLYTNPLNGGYVFEEIGGRGYFVKAFIHDGVRRSSPVYYGILNTSGASIFPTDLDKDRATGKFIEGKFVANVALFNKSVYRAQVKAIALVTGIGLKLWTGQDLNEEILDEKLQKIAAIENLALQYKKLTGVDYILPNLDYTCSNTEINRYGKELKKALDEARQNPSPALVLPPAKPSKPESDLTLIEDDDEDTEVHQGEIIDEPTPVKKTTTKKTTTKGNN